MESIRRGYIPSDVTEFGSAAQEKLKAAGSKLCFLLNRGYPVKAACPGSGEGSGHRHRDPGSASSQLR